MDALLQETPADQALTDSIRTESAPPPELPKAVEPPAAAPAVVPPTTPAEAPASEQPKPPAEAKKPEERPRLVPHQALHEERERRKQLERDLAEARKAQQAPEVPDETEDPIGTIRVLKQQLAGIAEQQQQARAIQELGSRIAARIGSYSQEHPEYREQYHFLQQSRVNELRHLGHDDQAIAQQIQMEEMSLGKLALDRDMDPGEMIANLAKARGWQAKVAEPTLETPAPVAPLAPPAQIVKEAEATIDRLARGQRAATSPSRSGGGAPKSDDLSIADILELDGAAFDSAAKAFIDREKRLGG